MSELVTFTAVALQQSKLVLGGCTDGPPRRAWIGRFDVSAVPTLDKSFGSGGRIIVPSANDECTKSIVIDSQHRIVLLLGSAAGPDRIVRLSAR